MDGPSFHVSPHPSALQPKVGSPSVTKLPEYYNESQGAELNSDGPDRMLYFRYDYVVGL